MASRAEQMRACFSAIVDKYHPEESDTDRGREYELRERTREILQRSTTSEANRKVFGAFSENVTAFLEQQIRQICDRLKTATTKRTKLWELLHRIRSDKGGVLNSKWNELLVSLKIEVFDIIVMQSVYEELFTRLIKEELSKGHSACNTSEEVISVRLSQDEVNALRYAAGFVPHSLLKRFEKRKGEKYSQFTTCLGEMAVISEESDILSYTTKWFKLVNRGGLFPLNDNSFSLFTAIEKIVKTALQRHMLSEKADKDSFKLNVLDAIAVDEEVQFLWCILSQDIDDPQHSQELLQEVIKLWVTIRGFSMVGSWVETYKQNHKKTVQKSTSLRKSIS